MKKFYSLFLVLCIVFSLSSCRSENSVTNSDMDNSSTQNQIDLTGTSSAEQSTDVGGSTTDTNDVSSDDSQIVSIETESSKSIEPSKPTESSEPVESSKPNELSKPIHTHNYSSATCTESSKCSCGVTKGSALGHSYSNATCTDAKKCSRCGAIDGSALGHKWQDATCKAPKTCSVCKQTEGSLSSHVFESGKCIYCQKDDIIDLNIGLLQNETYVSYKLNENGVLNEFTITFSSTENNVDIFSSGMYFYYENPDFDTTDAKTVNYNGKVFYGGDGGFGGYWFVVKDNTLQLFDEYNGWLYAETESVATYVMQHNGKLRLLDSKKGDFPYLYEIKK